MRDSLFPAFHNGVTLTAGERSGLLSAKFIVLIYEEAVNEDMHTKRSHN